VGAAHVSASPSSVTGIGITDCMADHRENRCERYIPGEIFALNSFNSLSPPVQILLTCQLVKHEMYGLKVSYSRPTYRYMNCILGYVIVLVKTRYELN
jgi:hypothetical protein